MPNDNTQRITQDVRTTWVMQDHYPIHLAGAALALVNLGPADATVRLYDSADGSTWSVLPFSDPHNTGLLATTLVGGAYSLICFQTARKYVKVALDDESPEGVMAQLFQWRPIPRPRSEYA